MTSRPEAGNRRWAGRLLLVVGAPVIFLGALECSLRLAGYGRPSGFLIPDPAVPGAYRTNPEFADLFLPDNFDLRPLNFRVMRRKPANTVRIVVLGESAAQGVPVPGFGFAPQLRAQLRAAYPGRKFEVLNTGIVAIDSHVLYRIAWDLVPFSPDLYIVYAGNNEVVGPYGPGCAYLSRTPPLWLIRASVWARATRTGQLLAAVVSRLHPRSHRAAEWGGMSMFVNSAVPGDDPRLAQVYANFAANLRGIVQAARSCGARVILCTPLANLKDCPPFHSEHRAGLSQEKLEAWEQQFDRGRLEWKLGQSAAAREDLRAALAIDDHYAESWYLLGRLDQAAGDRDAARREFVAALHWDALRFRPDPAIDEAIRDIARRDEGHVALVDTALLLGSDLDSTAEPAGRELLFEHVHLDWDGNYRVARLMAEAVSRVLFPPGRPSGAWLDSAGCAAALAYTPHERLPMLLRMEVLVRKPPFSDQITYPEDQARMERAIEAAARDRESPAVRRAAGAVASAALARDPENPALAAIVEGILLDQGDLEGALAMARRAERLLPPDYSLAADEASLLMRLGRWPEARGVLLNAAATPADIADLAPVMVQYWSRTGGFADGHAMLTGAARELPGDVRLRLADAELLRNAGRGADAEAEYRAILADEPGSEEALEGLIALLESERRSADADAVAMSASQAQPGDQTNDVRAAKLFEARGASADEIRCLAAAERSGPVNATFELTLALKLYRAGRTPEMMDHLAEAERLSRSEGNAAVTASIDRLIAQLRR